MCGIFVLIEQLTSSFIQHDYTVLNNKVNQLLYHRGPDSNGHLLLSNDTNNIFMVHTRLKINGNDTPQPIHNQDETIHLVINGEIFNWKELEFELNYKCKSSDCEIIIPLYEKYKDNIPALLNKINGQFSFVLYDKKLNKILIARDQIGVTPLYMGVSSNEKNKRIVISSEMKCLTMDDHIQGGSFVDNIKSFYPRQYIYCDLNDIYSSTPEKYKDFYIYKSSSQNYNQQDESYILRTIRDSLTQSVKLQLRDLIETNVPFGVLLSGGLDSSLIASLVVKLSKEMGYTQKIKTFSVGVNKDVPDLIAARQVSKYLDTEHHEFYFTITEGLESLESVIWHIESYDCTSVRASTPMYLLVKKIKEKFNNIKVLFSGELSDELLCYLYGANAPTESDFQLETINLVSNVHLFDCLRANKTCMAHNVEVRVPFTDPSFVEFILHIHPRWKMFGKNKRMEKQILRDSFKGYIPDGILYRKKEQFSDGVSGFENETNWIDSVKQFTDDFYLTELFNIEALNYTHNRPDTKEKLYYRQIFCKLFNHNSYKNTSELTVKQWLPKWSEDNDPSGRVQTFWNIKTKTIT